MRVITLDSNKKVTSSKEVGENYILQINDIVSQIGEIGQIQQADGSFIDDLTPLPPPPKTDIELLQEQLDITQASALQTSNDLQGLMDYLIPNS